MSIQTLRPNGGTSYLSGKPSTPTGAAQNPSGSSRQAVLSDDSDGTYIYESRTSGSHWPPVNFPFPTPPSGALPIAYRLRMRANRQSGSTTELKFAAVLEIDGVAIAGPWAASPTSQPFWPAFYGGTIPLTTATVTHGTAINFATPTSSLSVFPQVAKIGGQARHYELYLDFLYAAKPVTTVLTPTGTLSSTNRTTITWNTEFDNDGIGPYPQGKYQVKIFSAAQYAGLSSQASITSGTAVEDSGEIAGTAQSYANRVSLVDGSYRVYVRAAQNVGGQDHWGDWDYEPFTVSISRPGAPSAVATAQASNGRIKIDATTTSGATTTDAVQFQRRLNGSSAEDDWQDLRTADGDGQVAKGGSATVTAYDYETGNGQQVEYRVRSVKNYDTGEAATAWVSATGATQWSSTDWWLKCPVNPSLNAVVQIDSLAELNRAVRRAAFQAIGATKPVVISDTRYSAAGNISFRADTEAEQDALIALIESGEALLLQGVPGQHWDDRYLSLGDFGRTRAVDKSWVEAAIDSTDWIEVETPTGNLVA